jgi:hypothetical protein
LKLGGIALRSAAGINWTRKVTFMSPDEKAEMRAKALLQYNESTQEVAMLRDKITESGDFYIQAGQELKTDPFGYLSKKYVFTPAEVDALVQKWMDAIEENGRLKQKAIDYGASL